MGQYTFNVEGDDASRAHPYHTVRVTPADEAAQPPKFPDKDALYSAP